jgi:hypothetical protein
MAGSFSLKQMRRLPPPAGFLLQRPKTIVVIKRESPENDIKMPGLWRIYFVFLSGLKNA